MICLSKQWVSKCIVLIVSYASYPCDSKFKEPWQFMVVGKTWFTSISHGASSYHCNFRFSFATATYARLPCRGISNSCTIWWIFHEVRWDKTILTLYILKTKLCINDNVSIKLTLIALWSSYYIKSSLIYSFIPTKCTPDFHQNHHCEFYLNSTPIAATQNFMDTLNVGLDFRGVDIWFVKFYLD